MVNKKNKSGQGYRQISKRKNRSSTFNSNEISLDDINTVEYLPPVDTSNLLQKVRAAIFLTLDELWTIPSDIILVATLLDPRFKTFKWCKGDGKVEAEILVRELYNDIKQDLSPKNNENLFSNPSLLDDSDIFKALEGDVSLEEEEDDEINLYLQQRKIGLNDDPLKWWAVNKNNFPVLAQIARKYLSIPATSVSSERLFSDAGNHITAKRTRLSPDLVNKMLFLKRNSVHFDIFPPLE